MTTAALVFILLWFRISKKKLAQKTKASSILIAFLGAVVPLGWVWAEEKSNMLDEFAEMCSCEDGAHDYCKHVAEHNRLMGALPPGTPQRCLAEYLQLLAESAGCECLALGALRADFVMEAGGIVDFVIEAGSFEVDPTSLRPLAAGPSWTVGDTAADWRLH